MTMSRVGLELCVPASHASLPGHFPGRPVVPGVLLLQHVLAAIEQATGERVRHLTQVKFIAALQPDERATAWFDVDGAQVSFGVVTQRAGQQVMMVNGRARLRAGDGSPS
jgi:3-hydroxymyristoyl/3-hydroxydecanoyl-(acyl carrier protein) dehydratase